MTDNFVSTSLLQKANHVPAIRGRERARKQCREISNTIDFLTVISSIKKNEVYKNQIHGQQDKKVKEQFNDLQKNSDLFSEMSLSTYKNKMVEVFNAANIIYQAEKFKNLGEGTNSFVSADANWSEFYETLPFEVNSKMFWTERECSDQ